jgi:hypothetical protein
MAVQDDDSSRPKGIQRTRRLPDPKLGALWDSIILDDTLKVQLLSQAVLNFTLRGKVDRSSFPCTGRFCSSGRRGPARLRSRGAGASHGQADRMGMRNRPPKTAEEQLYRGSMLLVRLELGP